MAVMIVVAQRVSTIARADQILDAQRREHLVSMRELTRRKESGDLADQIICDHALLHLEADLRWLELTASRLTALADRLPTQGADK